MTAYGAALIAALLLSGCKRTPEIAVEIERIRAIDNHAHPVRPVANGEVDREFDALPVDNMEPSTDPMYLRPGDPGAISAWRALFGGPPGAARANKQSTMRAKGDRYPAWVLDQMVVDVMLANRVAMGQGIQPPRFLWVPFVDALMFPLITPGSRRRIRIAKPFLPTKKR
jgi:hypothetical protein